MKKVFYFISATIILNALFAGYSYAGVWDTAKGWLTGEVLALVISTLLAITGGALGLMFRKISRTFKEVGEFMAALGGAIEDRRLTREELAHVIREGRDIFEVWR